MLIADHKVVKIAYTLRNAHGVVLDSSEGGPPLAYIHGASQIVPGLEKALEGMQTGDEKDVVVAPGEGYGEPDPNGIFAVPSDALPPGAKLSLGDQIVGEDDEGNAIPCRVVEVRDDAVVVDANHPLAGVELHFHVKICEVRDATKDELQSGEVADSGDGMTG